ncbi:alpha/beta hydrolase [Rhodococcus olei]|uniref:Alpha/beta hydrolase n=1 Tax=Rhodococcus olei TaxID=2161675 RepID=A0ABP8P7W8_9NOCA
MSTSPIHPQHVTVDGLSIRYAESENRGPDALLLSPWPESVYAFEPSWAALAENHHLIAVDLPGFGLSESRPELFAPRAAGAFVLRIMDALGVDRVHVVGPDIGTSAVLFAASDSPERFHSAVIGTGAATVPLEIGEPITTWVNATDLSEYEHNANQVMTGVIAEIHPASPLPDHIREDYLASYGGRRFADSMGYVRSYPTELAALAEVLGGVRTPVRIVTGAKDTAIPPSNAEYLHRRLPHSSLEIVDSGHFIWEQDPATYASLVLDWWQQTGPSPAQTRE